MAENVPRSQSIGGDDNVQVMGDDNKVTIIHLPPLPIQEQNHVRFLAQLRSQYDELWKQSLLGAAQMMLGLTEKPDAVLHHTKLLFRSPELPERPLPEGTSIVEVYDKAGGKLLILGEPGAGKSTLLLDLARHLVERAAQDAEQPLPVIFPLSSWAEKKQPLQDWLPAQLSLIYDVPLQVGRAWVFKNQVLPLLDGLDEGPQEARLACIHAITTYRKEHLVNLVVCSRRAEYEEIERQKRLALQSAVVVWPLTRQQVETYLAQAGQPLAAVRTALLANPVLQELTTTPLMLSVLTLTYTGAQAHDLPQRGSAEVQQQQIFASYVEQMVERKGDVVRYPLQSTKEWLNWLAQQMQKRSATVFYLEHLQPDWLTQTQQRVYAWLAVRLPGILLGVLASLGVMLLVLSWMDPWTTLLYGVVGGCLGGLFSEGILLRQMEASRHQRYARLIGRRLTIGGIIGLIAGLSFGLNLLNRPNQGSDWLHGGLIFGVVFGLGGFFLQFISRATRASPSSSGKSVMQPRVGLVRLIWTVHGQRTLLVLVAIELSYLWSEGLTINLSYGLTFGLSCLLISLILEAQAEGIHLTERLKWSWSGLGRSLLRPAHVRTTLLFTGILAVGYGLSYGLYSGLSEGLSAGVITGLSLGLGAGLGLGLGYWLLLGLYQGVSSEQVEDKFRRIPNQGIQRSFRNSVLMGIIGGGVIWVIGMTLCYLLVYGLNNGLTDWLNSGLSTGLGTGLSDVRVELGKGLGTWLSPLGSNSSGQGSGWPLGVCSAILVCAITGGLSTLRHYIIRLSLWRTQTFPLNGPRFLDDATIRILLRRVGGGYNFVHRLILDYFASLSLVSPLIRPELPQPSQVVPEKVCSACGYQAGRPEAQFCPRCGRSLMV
jgi:NACHT domain